MKKIILLRHAKSSWKHPGHSDHERPLNKRGRAAAPVIGGWLYRKDHVPDVILCSTSVRTRETVHRLEMTPETPPVLELRESLYHASQDDLLHALQGLSDMYQSAMIVGHQPGLSTFAGMLAECAEAHCVQAYQHFPTAAAAIFEADVSGWSALAYCSAWFRDFVKPRDLDGD